MRSTTFSFFFLAAIKVAYVSGQLNCGPGVGKCGAVGMCCSEYGFCGSTPLHCGHGCQSSFSFSSSGTSASCYTDRPSMGRKCQSGKWMQNADAFNGDYKSADFLVHTPANLVTGNGATLLLTAPMPLALDRPGTGVKIASTSYMLYGRFSATIKAGYPGGMVTAFIGMSDEKDEIDWEWTGGYDVSRAQTNFFIKGFVEYGNHKYIEMQGSSTAEAFHDYEINWTPEKLEWIIDGQVVRTLDPSGGKYPNTPARVQLSVWDGGAGAAGTSQGDPEPFDVPERPAGYKAPTMYDKPPITGQTNQGTGKTDGPGSFGSNNAISAKTLSLSSIIITTAFAIILLA